ncbi:unnamed protein product [Parnassius apollo]|uniref:(apollo) hypothetical protein n=1 Tax=Parnassius apollo TaxID=110799 RepID=A0A8S3X1V3_PARAO|nr:unnamed protein product [Parnassius apollo]
MYDVAVDKFEEPEETLQVCWECLALLRRFDKFKKQVHTAQETILTLKDNHENPDHTYSFPQSLSTMGFTMKNGYDFCYDNTNEIQTEWTPKIVAVSFGDNIKNEPNNDEQMLESTQTLENLNTIVKPQIFIKQEPLKIEELNENKDETVLPNLTIRGLPLQIIGDIVIEHDNNQMEVDVGNPTIDHVQKPRHIIGVGLNKAPKTSAERGREFRARRALLKKQSKQQQEQDAIVEIVTEDIRIAEKRAKSAEATRRWREKKRGSESSKRQAKTAAQRMREYRERKKLAKKIPLKPQKLTRGGNLQSQQQIERSKRAREYRERRNYNINIETFCPKPPDGENTTIYTKKGDITMIL